MIATLLLILTTLAAGGDPCTLGEPIDWTAYALAGDSTRAATLRTEDAQFDLYSDGILFVYANDMAEGMDKHPHGECAVAL